MNTLIHILIFFFINFLLMTLVTQIANSFDKECQIAIFTPYKIWFSIFFALIIIIPELSFLQKLSLNIFLSISFCMAYMDYKYKEVYDVFHIINIFPIIIMFLSAFYSDINWMIFLDNFLFYLITQVLIFRYIYGAADTIYFTFCSIILLLLEKTLMQCYLFMLLAYVFVFAVQLIKGNVSKKIELKQPIAFIPYILTALTLCVL